MSYKYEVENNPRRDEGWEDMDKKCLFCNKVTTYFVKVENYRVCTSCLHGAIDDVKKSIMRGIK